MILEEASIDLHDHVVATFSVVQDDVPLTLDEVKALAPHFTLATLSVHPLDGYPEWKSQLLIGSEVAASLPTGGPGSDPEVLTSARQPGAEAPDTFIDLGHGRYRYVFANALSGYDPDGTVRVGVWLDAAASPSLSTSSTLDFCPSGGPLEARDTVLDENCGRCHGTLVAHRSRTRVRLCLTCHTWQNSDPDTIDPASMSTTATTDPNPLELDRLVHRIHRGAKLPTLYQSSSTAVPAPPLDGSADLPLPFSPSNNTTAVVGNKFSVVGDQSREFLFARVRQRTSIDGLSTRTVVEGVTFPRDLRDCVVCHENAAQGSMVTSAISRRICSGCHTDTWFGDATRPITDTVHYAHPGGPQSNDARCRGCHIDNTGTTAPKVYAPIAEAHVRPDLAPRYNEPIIEIVGVTNLTAGKKPSVTFRLSDRDGAIVPKPNAPVPSMDTESVATSAVPRKLTYFGMRVTGPTAPDFVSDNGMVPISSGTSAGNPDPLTLSTTAATDEYVYTFSSIVPAGTAGTWAVAMEARRQYKTPHYDKSAQVFIWPFTGETITESAENAVVYVDSSTGTWPPPAGSPEPVPRRTIVELPKCLRCHGRLELHGGTRHDPAVCVMCHTSDRTDWAQRPKVNGVVNLDATYDGIEERSIHFKMMIHRIHTGGRDGTSPASLSAIKPFLVCGMGGRPYFFEEIFPNDLRNCTLCHAEKTYLVDSVPSDAPLTIANETDTIFHAPYSPLHTDGEPTTRPIQAACTGCHATGATFAHVDSKTVGGVETCANCHVKGTVSVDVVHGLAPASGGASATFSSIVQEVFVPRCATAACHSGAQGVSPQLDADAAYAALVNVPSTQSSLKLVEPGAPEQSYLVYKLRGDAGAVGGSTPTAMPLGDSLLDDTTLRAIEAWISNGAPND